MYRYEDARQKHMEIYGSFLHCPVTGRLCSFMEETWDTGRPCRRTPCIMDDPKDIALKKRQAERQREREIEAKKKRGTGEEEATPIRRQTKSKQDLLKEKIEQLEKESERAYRSNRPRLGESKLYEAMRLRGQLKEEENKRNV